jgi:FlaA1/EpsC-like NDP-sugar epimerase
MRARETFMPWNDLELQLQVLLKLLEENDLRHIQRLMIELVHGYKPNEEISDWVFMEKRLKAACLEGS